MEPIKIKFWAVGEVICLIIAAICFIVAGSAGQLNIRDFCIVATGFAIICAVESEQKNAD